MATPQGRIINGTWTPAPDRRAPWLPRLRRRPTRRGCDDHR
ncbi:hypothetical protein [Actinophytocola sp.]